MTIALVDQGSAEPAAAPLDAAPVAPPVVLLDFDGVLVRGDTFHLFVRRRYATAPWRFLLVLVSAPVLLVQLLVSRLAAWHTFSRLALLGVHERRYQQLVDAFAAQLVRRSHACCRDGLRVLRQRLAAGECVLVVTGCEERLVSAIFRELGLAEVEVLAAQWRDGWSGMRLVRHNTGANKVQALARRGLDAWRVAYSDSLYDVPMLKLAAEAVLVNGSPTLCKKVEKALGRSITRVEWY